MDFEKAKEMPCFKDRLVRLRREYDKQRRERLPQLTRELFDYFYETGSRKEYEEQYFKRRSALLNAAFVSLIYGEGIDYLAGVTEEICTEFTWALPAHMAKETQNPERVIDLFAAETGEALSEICALLGDKLPQATVKTIKNELMRRIVLPFEEEAFAWEQFTHNWAAVCGGCVGITFMYMFPERFENIEDRIVKTMENYISGFGDDGISPEGLGYWNYGFWYFTGFADLYKRRYGIDIADNEKIKNIAMCQQNLFLMNNTVISFSDCGRTEHFTAALAHYYRNKFGDDIKILSTEIPDGVDNCFRFLTALRSILWIDERFIGIKETAPQESFFKDCEWYVNRRGRFAFSAKGGSNGESHNHNDIGSFIIADAGGQLAADYGAGEYTHDYFTEKRYEYLCTSSAGHSVPIIDGKYQQPGEKYCAKVTESENNVFAADISGAYDVLGLSGLVRSFEVNDSGVIMKDKFTFSDGGAHTITERIVSVIKPEVKDGRVTIGSLTMECADAFEIKSESLKAHNAKDDVLYIVDFAAGENFEVKFVIK